MATTISFTGLTAAVRHASRQVIDLTLDSDNDQPTDLEPPRKRARLDATTTSQGARPGSNVSLNPPRTFKTFRLEVVRRIKRSLDHYPTSESNRQSLGIRLMKAFFEDGKLAESGRAAGWVLTPEKAGVVEARILSMLGSAQHENQSAASTQYNIPPSPSRPTNVAAQWSPSGLAHRPTPEVRRPSSTTRSTSSQSPVPLPAYASSPKRSSASPGTGLRQPQLSLLARNSSKAMLQNMLRASEGNDLPEATPARAPASPATAEKSSTPANKLSIATSAKQLKHQATSAGNAGTKQRLPCDARMLRSGKPTTKETSTRYHVPKYAPLQATMEIRRTMRSANYQEAVRQALPGQQGSPIPQLSPARSMSSAFERKPYLLAKDRREIANRARRQGTARQGPYFQSIIYHTDMTDDELRIIDYYLGNIQARPISLAIIKHAQKRVELARYLCQHLKDRTIDDVENFLQDLPEFDATRTQLQTSVARDDFVEQHRRRDRRLNAARLGREMDGARGVSACMSQLSLQTEACKDLDDSISHIFASFTGCSGNVTTMSWVSNQSILCGATSTMDTRTLDHNKSGNLVLYSAATDTIHSFKDHREVRRAKEGDAPDLSRAKWLYPSIVSSATDAERGLVFTASFDRSVKIWKVEGNVDTSMSAFGTWPHDGKVNFVATALNGSGLVATAADVSSEAVRVYSVKGDDPGSSAYKSFSCPRHDDSGSDEWAYWPSTLQWGTAPDTQHLLAVGYSPRSRDGDENQIPEDKRRTGAILLWDSKSGKVIPVHAPTMANVFEVVWHPARALLIVATSRSGPRVARGIRTQVRIWKQDPDRKQTDQGWHEYKTLDCTADDINELTVMPNSFSHAYVTASCTSGEIFVWDTARGDRPIHVLRHGPMIEPAEDEDDRRRRDVGVKFTAWGQTPDRLFTGSSDGKVNVWNIRKEQPFIRTIMEGEGAIFCGAFSPDRRILAIGDEPGNVWLLADPDDHTESWGAAIKKRHVPVIVESDDEDDGNTSEDVDSSDYPRKRYLDSGELVMTGNAVIGVVQGPSYHDSIHFDKKSHLNEDPSAPLIPSVERRQQHALRATPRRRRKVRRLKPAPPPMTYNLRLHAANRGKDFNLDDLDITERLALSNEGAELEAPEEDLNYESDEELPRSTRG